MTPIRILLTAAAWAAAFAGLAAARDAGPIAAILKPAKAADIREAEPATAAAPERHAAWSYAGEAGPAHWGDVRPDYAVCGAGAEQSPIDLTGAVEAAIGAPAIYWAQARVGDIVNNGHTIQANFSEAGHIVIDAKRYDLLQVHFHAASEHTLAGRRFPLEGHLVHRASDGALAVIGIFFEEGAENFALTPLFKAAPATPGSAAIKDPIDLRDLLPGDRTAFRYQGSLTTPPCSEVVAWTVFEQPVQASRDQIRAFTRIYNANFRPLQPTHRRFVLKTN
jgi:carbonic anhydrase